MKISYPSLWQSWKKDTNGKKVKYNDFEYHIENGIHHIKYDKPAVQTFNNHMLKKGALFFRREDGGYWRFVGYVLRVHEHVDAKYVSLDVREYNFKNLFKTKSSAAVMFGFKHITQGPRMNGLIELITAAP